MPWFEVVATETVTRTYIVGAYDDEEAKTKLLNGEELYAFTEGGADIDEIIEVKRVSE